MTELFAVFGILIGAVGLGVISGILRGYVLSVLWGWFIVTTFNAPPLSIPVALGISTTISLLTHQYNKHKPPEEESDSLGVQLLYPLTVSGFALLFGWIFHQFV